MMCPVSETKPAKKCRGWLIAVIAVVVALAIAAVVLWSTGVFAKWFTPSVTSPEQLAEDFVKAYCLKDMPTQFSLSLQDERRQWEDGVLADHKTEEAFCEVVQKQADEKGLDVTIRSFDDYLAAYHQRMLSQMEEFYGPFTVDAKVIEKAKMTDEELDAYRDKLLGGFNGDYYDEQQLDAVTEAYSIRVGYTVDGEKEDFYEEYIVSVVKLNDRWLIGDHSN